MSAQGFRTTTGTQFYLSNTLTSPSALAVNAIIYNSSVQRHINHSLLAPDITVFLDQDALVHVFHFVLFVLAARPKRFPAPFSAQAHVFVLSSGPSSGFDFRG